MCVLEGLEIANAVVSAFRAVDIYQDVQETKRQSEIETKTLIAEAKTLKEQAAIERQEGIEKARKQKLTSILNMQKEKTLFASNNILATSQTALNIFDDEKLNGELTALNTIKESEDRSNKYLQTANDYYKKASLTSFKGKQAYQEAMFNNIGGSIISLASTLGD